MNSSIFILLSFCAFYCAQAQYGGQPSYSPPAYAPPSYSPPQYYPPAPMNDNYVCTIQAHYDLFGQNGKREFQLISPGEPFTVPDHRPTTNFCQDAYKFDACERCCRMTARIQGTSINEVISDRKIRVE
ncbi:hypothetical protein CAEBREN_17001 [Caenorhabditis brenneri]|uniref:Uncharacterized protein n=1 Tax=Caenorhabditis brenneri TaxID=135651 RepID=G0NZT7_CAEBE|nr:hypothetical protein CAEBREN_17001 [Caenorhabditis brenneri]